MRACVLRSACSMEGSWQVDLQAYPGTADGLGMMYIKGTAQLTRLKRASWLGMLFLWIWEGKIQSRACMAPAEAPCCSLINTHSYTSKAVLLMLEQVRGLQNEWLPLLDKDGKEVEVSLTSCSLRVLVQNREKAPPARSANPSMGAAYLMASRRRVSRPSPFCKLSLYKKLS